MTQGKDKPGASNKNESMASFSNERTNAHFQDITTDLDLMLPVKTGESEAKADMIEIDFVIDEDKYEKVWT